MSDARELSQAEAAAKMLAAKPRGHAYALLLAEIRYLREENKIGRDDLSSALASLDAAEAQRVSYEKALTAIAEGNLGDMPWQANLQRLSDFAAAALAPFTAGEQT